jgi:hypothetical protein
MLRLFPGLPQAKDEDFSAGFLIFFVIIVVTLQNL